jgi:hypothetical protein
VQTTVDPAQLILAGRPIAADWMHVAVDQSGNECRALGVDRNGGTGDVGVFLFANSLDHAINGDNRVSVENGVVEVSAEKKTDVADH